MSSSRRPTENQLSGLFEGSLPHDVMLDLLSFKNIFIFVSLLTTLCVSIWLLVLCFYESPEYANESLVLSIFLGLFPFYLYCPVQMCLVLSYFVLFYLIIVS